MIEDNDDDESDGWRTYMIRPSAVQAEKKNLGEARA